MELVARGAVGLLPVLVFLGTLLWLDSYKLVGLRPVLATIGAGALAAAACYGINLALLGALPVDFGTYSRFIAPLVEELLKGALIVYLIRRHAIGFPVDAAIFGFAIGAGFAVVENIYYLGVFRESHIVVWVVRGFGTAIMHGGATAIFAIVAHTLAEKRQAQGLAEFLPGLLLATIIHSVFNQFLFAPVYSTLGILLFLPPLMFIVFDRSERALQHWLAEDFDADMQLLALLNSGDLAESRLGRHLEFIKDHFPPEVVADILCYLRLHVELSMRASAMLLMKESGLEPQISAEVRAMVEELRYLEKSIGVTGQHAVRQFLRLSSRDLWQLYMLGK
jgi:RsiW-degrading membrane proteinase PrsW (M82 family)